MDADRNIREARGGKLIGDNDVTEIDLDDVQDWDYRIENNEDYSVLKQKVLKIVELIQKSKKF